ncbi:hypothetical protein [Legionella shakespearei]|uniref:Ankyrin repeats (3 copies) n=1 Tax=Legionella shakespearei DSM 23087 TaxID=1122169 RepID=A0A0W0YQI6_9GAMM|nr:hypothetical protein [Legionella shakespearei]KTD58894.1 Ankyrin repeats (3 copies) [Legionella shakespearei DSM 23087]
MKSTWNKHAGLKQLLDELNKQTTATVIQHAWHKPVQPLRSSNRGNSFFGASTVIMDDINPTNTSPNAALPPQEQLLYACIKNEPDVIQRHVRDFESNQNINYLKNCACRLAYEGKIEALKRLMAQTTAIDYLLLDDNEPFAGWNLLHWAIRGNRRKMSLFLINTAPELLLNRVAFEQTGGNLLHFIIEFCTHFEVFEAIIKSEILNDQLDDLLNFSNRQGYGPVFLTMVKIAEPFEFKAFCIEGISEDEIEYEKRLMYGEMLTQLMTLEFKFMAAQQTSIPEDRFNTLAMLFIDFYKAKAWYCEPNYDLFFQLLNHYDQIKSELSPTSLMRIEDWLEHARCMVLTPFLKACHLKNRPRAIEIALWLKESGLDHLIHKPAIDWMSEVDYDNTDPYKRMPCYSYLEYTEGLNALQWAILQEKTDKIPELLKASQFFIFITTRPCETIKGEQNLLHLAISTGRKKSLRCLLDHIPEHFLHFLMKTKDQDGHTPMSLLLSLLQNEELRQNHSDYLEMKQAMEQTLESKRENKVEDTLSSCIIM